MAVTLFGNAKFLPDTSDTNAIGADTVSHRWSKAPTVHDRSALLARRQAERQADASLDVDGYTMTCVLLLISDMSISDACGVPLLTVMYPQ